MLKDRRLGAFSLAVLSCLVAAPAPVVARAARVGRLPALAGRTVIEGSSTGFVEIRLTHPVKLSDMDFRLRAGGRISGFVLAKAHERADIGDKEMLLGVRTGRCHAQGCTSSPQPFFPIFQENVRNDRLTAGTYRVYLVADGSRSRLTISTTSLEGVVSLAVRHMTRSDIQTFEPVVRQTDAGAVYSGGAHSELSGDGLAAVAIWYGGSTNVASVAGECLWQEEPTVPDEIAFGPACPTQDSNPQSTSPEVGEYGTTVYRLSRDRLPAAMGGYVMSASDALDVGGAGLWLRF